jgi:hypothetical protein
VDARGRAERWAPAAALAALLAALFWKTLLRGEVFYERDIHLIFLGQTDTFVRAVLSGSWPVWDPYTAFGQPLLANPDAHVLYPPHWLNLLMPPATYYVLFVLGHLFFSAWGMRALARRLGLSEGGALVAAALWTATGPVLSLINVWHHFASAAWIPWVLLASDRAVTTGGRRDVALWGTAAGLQVLAGSADMTAMTAALTFAHIAARAGRGPHSLPLGRIALAAAGAGVLALALSAGLWLPTMDVASRSDRLNLPVEVRTTWSVHPASLIQVVLPLPLHRLPLDPGWRAALFDSREPFLLSYYLGVVGVALVAGALAGPRRPGRGVFAGTLVVAVLAALGKHTPFYGLLTMAVPPLRMIRYPSKALVMAALAWALLAAMGYDAWKSAPAGDRDRWRRAVAVPLLALTVAAWAVGLLVWREPERVGGWLLDPQFSDKWAMVLAPLAENAFLAGLACAAAAALAWGRGLRPSASARAVAALALLDLFLANRSLNPTAPRKMLAYRPATLDYVDQRDHSRLYAYDYFGVIGKKEKYLKHDAVEEAQRVRERWPYRFAEVITLRSYLLPPVGAIWGLYGSYDLDMRGLYPVPQARLALLLRGIEGTPGHLRLLRMGAVRRMITYHSEGLGDLSLLTRLPGLGTEPIHVYGVPDPLPRAYVVSGARIADGHDALAAVLDPEFDSRREVVLAEGAPAPVDPAFTGAARIDRLAADRVRLQVDLTTRGYAVLVDSYDPGWRATVDGKAAPVLRANVAFRAVPVEAGRHVVELVYRPPTVLIGLGLTGAGAVAAGLAAWPSRRGARR